MTIAYGRVGVGAAIAALIGVGACSGKSTAMDKSLEQDLAAAGGGSSIELASKSISPNLVISASEAGPTAARSPAAHKAVPKLSAKPTVRVAERIAPSPSPIAKTVVDAPAPSPVVDSPTPATSIERPAAHAAEPPPLPAVGPSRSRDQQKGVYKTEGQIFQQMPWIKP